MHNADNIAKKKAKRVLDKFCSSARHSEQLSSVNAQLEKPQRMPLKRKQLSIQKTREQPNNANRQTTIIFKLQRLGSENRPVRTTVNTSIKGINNKDDVTDSFDSGDKILTPMFP
eukprot:TRINITY_DN3808_c0_g9_i1.p1 TRINITY_DN3808_c0_g9~~TRINITY_DN3808_c0_g9_i1.p1  ORF type:complete len:128 (-),score=7.96 TRINITY_DN3808_c0_g9_i1:46-390(-)